MRGILIFSLGSRENFATSISLMSAGKSTAHWFICSPIASSTRLTTNAPRSRMCAEVSFRPPPGFACKPSTQSAGSSLKMLKNENGAAFTTPVGPIVVTSAIGRGITRLMRIL